MENKLRELPLMLLRSIADGLGWLLTSFMAPFRERQDDEDEERRRRPWWRWFWQIPVLLVYWGYRLGLAIITFPVRAWFLPREQRNCFLRGLPALIAAVLVLIGIAAYSFLQDRIMIRYASRTQASISRNEPSVGVRYAFRLLTESRERRQENAYLYALLLSQSGEESISNEVFATIAPDNEKGFPPAHQIRAMGLVRQIAQNADDETLERLRWHLEQSGTDKSERSLALWARYHQATGEFEESAAELKQAGRMNPIHFLNLWEMEERRGNAQGAADALETARQEFASLLSENPLMKLTRLQLAMTLTKQNRIQDAERVLLAGLQLHRDLDMQNAVADFYILRFDAIKNDAPVIERLGLLTRALSTSLNNRAIYDRLAQLFGRDLTSDERQNIRGLLEDLLVSGANPAIAHFGLGFLGLLDPATSTQGAWHLKQAITLQPVIALACNNLSTVLLQQDPPRLDEALELARAAVAASPKTAGFHETLGSVLVARQEWSEAVQELNLALESGGNAKPIHGKLVQAYEGLGQPEDAQRHRELAQ